jgi:hypothetical protein
MRALKMKVPKKAPTQMMRRQTPNQQMKMNKKKSKKY